MTASNSSNVSIGPKDIGAVTENDEDNVDEYLGFLVFSTTGEAEVPREWLLEQWENHGLPLRMLPKEPSMWSAYRRAMRNLVDNEVKNFSIHNSEYDYHHDAKYRLEKNSELGSNTFLLYVDVFWPEELTGEEGGDWKETKIGRFDFHQPEDGGVAGVLHTAEVDKDNHFREYWEEMAERSRRLFKRYQTHHVDSDLQKMLRVMRNNVARAVPIRRSVYFFGNHHQDVIEGVSSVWEKMNRFKVDGEEMRVESTPVVNLESQRELVASRAREMLEEMVDEIVNETLQEWEDEEEQTAEETAREIMNQLGESGEIASEYNALLQARLSVKDILQNRMEEFTDTQEDIIERVLDQQELGDYE